MGSPPASSHARARASAGPPAPGAAAPPEGPRSRIAGVGVRLPEARVSTRALLERCRLRHAIDLERLTGIRERRVCGPGEDSFTLAVDAARDCLARSATAADEIEMVVSCSITNFEGELDYRLEPSLAFRIAQALGARRAVPFDLRNACAGMVSGIYVLDDFIRRGAIRRGLVVSGEQITSISENATRSVRTILSRQLASLTVGDAGAAALLERAPEGAPGVAACELATYAEHADLCVGVPCPSAPGAIMRTDARKLHRIAIDAVVPTLRDALARSGLALRDVDVLVPHQTSVRAIRAGERAIPPRAGGPPRHVVYNLEAYGNTASTSHFVALHRYLEEGRIAAGDRVCLLVFASGVVVGALVFTMDELRERYGIDPRGDGERAAAAGTA